MVLKLKNNNSTLVFGKANSAGDVLIQILRVSLLKGTFCGSCSETPLLNEHWLQWCKICHQPKIEKKTSKYQRETENVNHLLIWVTILVANKVTWKHLLCESHLKHLDQLRSVLSAWILGLSLHIEKWVRFWTIATKISSLSGRFVGELVGWLI